jgi:hypothetical protein
VRSMAEIKRLVMALESDEGFFGMVQQRSIEGNISLVAAWQEVEALREEIGMKHRYSSAQSFYVCRHRFHRSGGEIFRFQEDEDIENQ